MIYELLIVSIALLYIAPPYSVALFSMNFELLTSTHPLLYIKLPLVELQLVIVILSTISVYPLATVINWYLLPPSSVMLFPFIVSFFVVCVVFAQFIVFVML